MANLELGERSAVLFPFPPLALNPRALFLWHFPKGLRNGGVDIRHQFCGPAPAPFWISKFFEVRLETHHLETPLGPIFGEIWVMLLYHRSPLSWYHLGDGVPCRLHDWCWYHARDVYCCGNLQRFLADVCRNRSWSRWTEKWPSKVLNSVNC